MDTSTTSRLTASPKMIELPSDLVAQINTVLSDMSLENFVYQAIKVYADTMRNHQEEAQLAADYDQLANIYDELAEELADETWLPLENEALLRTEEKVGS